MNIAVTGSIGSGKSVVARELGVRLAALYCDADQLCRELLEKDAPGWQQFVLRWQDRYLDADGNIDRTALRLKIFADDGMRRQLENILHPLVRGRLQELMGQSRRRGKHLVAEIPLLFETGWQHQFDRVVTVYAEPEVCIRRVMARDGVSSRQARQALDAQMNIEKKVNKADYVVDNSETMEKTLLQVEALSRDLKGWRHQG